MWTPFGEIKGSIKITKSSIINYINNNKEFKKDDFIKNFIKIFEYIGKDSEEDKQEIKNSINQNLKYLLNLNILKKEGNVIKRNYEPKVPNNIYL